MAVLLLLITLGCRSGPDPALALIGEVADNAAACAKSHAKALDRLQEGLTRLATGLEGLRQEQEKDRASRDALTSRLDKALLDLNETTTGDRKVLAGLARSCRTGLAALAREQETTRQGTRRIEAGLLELTRRLDGLAKELSPQAATAGLKELQKRLETGLGGLAEGAAKAAAQRQRLEQRVAATLKTLTTLQGEVAGLSSAKGGKPDPRIASLLDRQKTLSQGVDQLRVTLGKELTRLLEVTVAPMAKAQRELVQELKSLGDKVHELDVLARQARRATPPAPTTGGTGSLAGPWDQDPVGGHAFWPYLAVLALVVAGGLYLALRPREIPTVTTAATTTASTMASTTTTTGPDPARGEPVRSPSALVEQEPREATVGTSWSLRSEPLLDPPGEAPPRRVVVELSTPDPDSLAPLSNRAQALLAESGLVLVEPPAETHHQAETGRVRLMVYTPGFIHADQVQGLVNRLHSLERRRGAS